MSSILLTNVDKEMLEEQRLQLAYSTFTLAFEALLPEQQLAIQGIINMLDAWSDREIELERRGREFALAYQAAADMYVTDTLEIDEDCYFSESDDGTWVSAWVWVPWEATKEEE
jgi:hypothetical protein